MLKTCAASDALQEETSGLHVPLVWLEFAVGLILLGAAGYYMHGALMLPKPLNVHALGAGDFPIIIATGLLGALLLLLALSLVKIIKGVQTTVVSISRPLAISVGVLVLLGHAMSLETIGASVSTAVFAALIMLVSGERRPMPLLLIPLALTVGVYLVFSVALGVPFP
ncbi:tripartite tricarboxylate transporter TctB family protein [Pseudomonas sp. M30-35]|uniref:tripartite tricarboxylate transporter TctB family protein n=1 Tax=Pseudomonas sp. M30-35 TaxID=1981174 RepID=UPI0012FD0925|nr:tripartite tricarboxylate transporter TctB family protein [Pseudomonas sp. M30-35]